MVVDTSALLAILQGEPERRAFIDAMQDAEGCRLSGASLVETAMDRAVIASVERLTILADHTKFSQRGPVRLAEVPRISTLVTDAGAPEEGVRRLKDQGVEVVLA